MVAPVKRMLRHLWMPRWLVRNAMYATLREGTLEMFQAIETRAGAGG